MHDPKIIEAMARAAWDSQWPDFPWDADEYEGSADCRKATEAALTALCAAHPDVAALLRGEAVAVPREATQEMLEAPLHVGRPWGQHDPLYAMPGRKVMESRADLRPTIYRAMLAASPWAQEAARDE